MKKRWVMPHVGAPPSAGPQPELHPIVARLLASRGIISDEETASFLDPSWEKGLHDPFLFSHMKEAVARIYCAIESGEHITVHGDYDADGVTGSAVMITTLREIEARISYLVSRMSDGGKIPDTKYQIRNTRIDSYIPHRDKEGYGLNPASVRYLKEQGTSLIITVDCGIANVEEIAQARGLGMDVVVVDHHQFGDVLPDAILIHPKLPGERYPFPHLAAVGVAWKLACALVAEARNRGMDIADGFEKWLMDLVSIATVTDMVPLVGENRVLETFGLKVLNKTRRPGLRMLVQSAGYALGSLTAESVAFGIGPRINAAGRMDHASLALRLLLADTESEAAALAAQLEARNRERQKAVARMMEEAAELDARFTDHGSRITVLWSENWSPALVGLVAGKYLDRTGRPTIAIGKHGDRWVGSGRSFAAYDITAAVRRAGEGILSHSGGHVQACGFSFGEEVGSGKWGVGKRPIEKLLERLIADAERELAGVDCSPTLQVDAELGLEEIDWSLIETLARLEPFGIGFTRPQFMSRRLTVASSELVGQTQKHIKCVLASPGGKRVKFIGFNKADRAEELRVGITVDVVYDVGVNEWNGRKDIQCKLIDVRKSE